MLVNINFLNVEHKNQAEQTLDNESLAVGWNDGDDNINCTYIARVNDLSNGKHMTRVVSLHIRGSMGIPELSETENKNGTNSYEFHCPYAYSCFLIQTTYYNLK